MRLTPLVSAGLLCLFPALAHATRETIDLDAGWAFRLGEPAGNSADFAYTRVRESLLAGSARFSKGTSPAAGQTLTTSAPYALSGYDDSAWRRVDLPHDWGIESAFRQDYPGETGKLPWWGVAWYRRELQVPASDAGRSVFLEIDGAMSHATVWCNGRLAGGWPYGYTSFRVDLTPHLKPGASNTLAIRLDNPPDSSRWYPGGGLYRDVRLVKTDPVHVAQYGVRVVTKVLESGAADVALEVEVDNQGATEAGVVVESEVMLLGRAGETLTRNPTFRGPVVETSVKPGSTALAKTAVRLERPALWSLESPSLYAAVVRVLREGRELDREVVRFGVRDLRFTPDRGLLLNGKRVPLNGVCMHHDLGALGAAFNRAAAERQLRILGEMGVNAIRTTHNPAAPGFLDLCDELGFLVIGESFDCWMWGKTPNDYAKLFEDWHERDLRALVRRDRNRPSMILWSIGNEIVKVEANENTEVAKRLIAIVREEDPTRGATAGMNNTPVGFNGVQKLFDVFGFNYRSMFYKKFRESSPEIPVYGSETASTVSSRGEYFFPVTEPKNGGMSRFQMSSYDLYAPRWAWPPDAEFKWIDEAPGTLGEFVWTGFDYLGEPTPYNSDWSQLMNIQDPVEKKRLEEELAAVGAMGAPSRSSYFGIVDLAGFPKDRFFLYQARWRPDHPMAHILPHWTWPERVGEITPVHVYSSGDEAELFLNGRSLGKKKRGQLEYRFRWDDVRYEPGELKVVTWKDGKPWAESVNRTAGPATQLLVSTPERVLAADGRDLAFVSVMITDAAGNLVPRADNLLRFEVSGAGVLAATDNGDATSHVPFSSPERRAYNGLALGILRALPGAGGEIRVRITAEGLKPVEVVLRAEGGR